jgi:hypothetical protein
MFDKFNKLDKKEKKRVYKMIAGKDPDPDSETSLNQFGFPDDPSEWTEEDEAAQAIVDPIMKVVDDFTDMIDETIKKIMDI